MDLLVIPDIHNHIETAEAKIAKHPGLPVLFLGDYFDSFDDNANDAEKTAHWLKKSLATPGRTHLFGNHDLSYWHLAYRCSGYDYLKDGAIARVMKPPDWQKLRVMQRIDGVLYSHAGFSKRWTRSYGTKFEELDKMLHRYIFSPNPKNEAHPLLEAGISSGGIQSTGGVTWARWRNDFIPIPEQPQVMGHTPQIVPNQHENAWCLDSRTGQYYAVVSDGKVELQHL